jgi:hypothetical protein
MLHIFLFISTFIISNSNAMEIVKSNGNQKKYAHPFFEKYLLIQEICYKNNIPRDINKYITQYHIALRNNHLLSLLKNGHSFMLAWNNAHIPINYYHLLNNTQIQLLQEIFQSPSKTPIYLPQYWRRQKRNLEDHYFLQSEKEYQLFLTLPIELRKCLTKAPHSLIYWKTYLRKYNNSEDIIPTVINAFQVIQVKSKLTKIKHKLLHLFNIPIDADFLGYTPQPIVPEEKNNKDHT